LTLSGICGIINYKVEEEIKMDKRVELMSDVIAALYIREDSEYVRILARNGERPPAQTIEKEMEFIRRTELFGASVSKDLGLLRHIAIEAVEKMNAINSKIWEEFNEPHFVKEENGGNIMREFKVGDRIKVVKNIGHPDYDCNIGKEFKVLAVDEEDVDIDAPGIFGTDSSTWHFSELELVREGEK
jgi:hypothetical protein